MVNGKVLSGVHTSTQYKHKTHFKGIYRVPDKLSFATLILLISVENPNREKIDLRIKTNTIGV